MNFVERLLRPSALLDLANILKFTAISAMLLEHKIRCQNSPNLTVRGISVSNFVADVASPEFPMQMVDQNFRIFASVTAPVAAGRHLG